MTATERRRLWARRNPEKVREARKKQRQRLRGLDPDDPIPTDAQALRDLVFRCVSTVEPKSSDMICNQVRDDWGSISTRSVLRHLAKLEADGLIHNKFKVYWRGSRLTEFEACEIAGDIQAEYIRNAYHRKPWVRNGTISGKLRGGALKVRRTNRSKISAERAGGY